MAALQPCLYGRRGKRKREDGEPKDEEEEKDVKGDGFYIKHQNSYFMRSDTILSEELFNKGEFFNTVEKGYQSFYEQSITPEWQGGQTPTGEQENL